MTTPRKPSGARQLLCGLGLLTALGLTGCQVDVAGQTLPSGFFYQDDIQYFAPGTEFKLPREAAALQAYNEEQAREQR